MSGDRPSGIVVVDYGAGNLVSIRNALTLLGAAPTVATEPGQVRDAAVVLVPGVGASGPAMERLERAGLATAIRDAVGDGAWYVGICLGLQLLFDRSEEDGAEMLGLLAGEVVLIADAPRLPHIGWNQLDIVRPDPLLDGLADGAPAYFVHSYVARPADRSIVLAETEHGSRFPSVIAQGRIVGYQPHPERSGVDGLRLLRNLLTVTGILGAGATEAIAQPVLVPEVA
ncbi:MAG: imidazole glycerol phosphate synthase subunit HisH [Chloroflexi bacterium]|nr:imidazole glycerol phosphate synthase subunit HisH [Chloroflexota bacterium]